MKKTLAILLALVMVFACAAAAFADSDAPVTFKFLQGQPEYQTGARKLVEAYTKLHPNVTIEIVTDANLTTDLQTGNIPEIFYTEGYGNLVDYFDYLEDLSDQSWVENLTEEAKESVYLDGKCYGWPTSYSALGIVYNKTMFAEHGWEVPKTFAELEALCEKIEADGIQPFFNEWGDDWSIGHMTFAGGITYLEDTADVIAKAYKGEAKFSDYEEMAFLQNYVDLMKKYGAADPMSNGWNEFCVAMATEQAAMGFEGDFIWSTIEAIDPTIELGMFALPNENADETKMCMGYTATFHIGKGSKEPEAAKEFLAWMSTSEEAKAIIMNDYQFTGGFGWDYVGSNKLLNDAMEYLAEGKITPWYWNTCPVDFRAQTGIEIQKYISGDATWDEVLEGIDMRWNELTTK